MGEGDIYRLRVNGRLLPCPVVAGGMQPKRELTSVDLAAVTTALGKFTDARVDKVYLYPDALLRLRMRHHAHGRVELIIQVGPLKRIHTVDPLEVPDAPDRPPEFAKMLRSHLAGAELTAVSQVGFDRIVELAFSRPDGDRTLVAELFGDGNIALVDEAGDVIQPLRTVRVTARSVAPGEPYKPPEQRINPLRIDQEAFIETMRASDADIVRTLATQLNLGGRYAEELCARADVEGTTSVEAADQETLIAVWSALQSLDEQISEGDFSPVVYHADDHVVDVAPIALQSVPAGTQAEPGDDVLSTFERYFTAYEPPEPAGGDADDPLAAEIARTERIIAQQQGAIEDFAADADRERARAEALYREYGLVDEIITAISDARAADHGWAEIGEELAAAEDLGPAGAAIVDIDGARGEVTVAIDELEVPVDVSMGVERNADRRYRAAKDIEQKREGAKEALAATERELAELHATEDPAPAQVVPADDRPVTGRAHVPIRRADAWYESYRWFETTDGYLVIGGRNATQNEEIVKKYLDPTDRFFHTDAPGGPVVILKASRPSEPATAVEFDEATLAQVAQFTISSSSVWKAGVFAGDVYMVSADQVSKTPESGEYIEKGSFVIRGQRTYFRGVATEAAVGVQTDPVTQVIGGPPEAVEARTVESARLQPGQYAADDVAKLLYRRFKEAFADERFIREIASPDQIVHHVPPGTSDIIE